MPVSDESAVLHSPHVADRGIYSLAAGSLTPGRPHSSLRLVSLGNQFLQRRIGRRQCARAVDLVHLWAPISSDIRAQPNTLCSDRCLAEPPGVIAQHRAEAGRGQRPGRQPEADGDGLEFGATARRPVRHATAMAFMEPRGAGKGWCGKVISMSRPPP